MAKTIEEQLLEIAQNTIIKKLEEGYWLRLSSGSVQIDPTFLKNLYDNVDMDKVLQITTDKLETKIADKILSNMAQEIKTDLNKILSDAELREDIRFYLKRKIKEKAETLSHE